MGVQVAQFVFPRGRDSATAVNVGRQKLCLNPLSLHRQRPRSRKKEQFRAFSDCRSAGREYRVQLVEAGDTWAVDECETTCSGSCIHK